MFRKMFARSKDWLHEAGTLLILSPLVLGREEESASGPLLAFATQTNSFVPPYATTSEELRIDLS